MSFALHQRLAADTLPVTELAFCKVLLMNDSRFPWLVLVPKRAGLSDFHDVAPGDKSVFMAEIDKASRVLKAETRAFKLNVAALGNLVPQLHVHVVARFQGDQAWPGPVWGVGKSVPYASDAAESLVIRLRTGLTG